MPGILVSISNYGADIIIAVVLLVFQFFYLCISRHENSTGITVGSRCVIALSSRSYTVFFYLSPFLSLYRFVSLRSFSPTPPFVLYQFIHMYIYITVFLFAHIFLFRETSQDDYRPTRIHCRHTAPIRRSAYNLLYHRIYVHKFINNGNDTFYIPKCRTFSQRSLIPRKRNVQLNTQN